MDGNKEVTADIDYAAVGRLRSVECRLPELGSDRSLSGQIMTLLPFGSAERWTYSYSSKRNLPGDGVVEKGSVLSVSLKKI